MIRHADPQRDGAPCAAIYAPYVDGRGTSFEERPPARDEFARRIERVSAGHPWLVAERGSEIAGFAYATSHRERPAYRWTAETSVYIAGDHQGQGVGKALYGALFELLRRQGLHVALAGITLPNEASVGLHESFGFERVGVYRQVGFKAGGWRDVSWWQLMLAPLTSADPAEPLGPQRLRP
jgi:L-amino acid N-acyltransferase YncA